MKTTYLAFALLSLASTSVLAGDHNHSLVKACSKECPGAKTEKDVHSCAEKKEGDPKFKASACGIAHAKHEKEEESHAH